ncbi:MAG: hypothetical protein FWH08_05760 [Oscillospiraceae bacterium]|nr:hypothetical protein [Oscillospiraceae bacterium]
MKRNIKRNGKSSRALLNNIVVLGAAALILSVYFSTKYLWSIATIVIIALILLAAGFQIWIYCTFFRNKS